MSQQYWVVLPDGEGSPVRERNEPGKAARWKRWGPLALVVAIMFGVWQSGLVRYLSYESIVLNNYALSAFVAENLLLAVLAYFAIYFAAVALSLPGAVAITIAGGLLFGTVFGSALTVLAATLGATVIFLIAKTSFESGLRDRAGPFLGKLADGFHKDAFHYMLFLRLVPVFPFWLINLAPALLGVRLPTFVFATLIGIIPGTVAFTAVGAGLDTVIEAQYAEYMVCVGQYDGVSGACAVSFDPSTLINANLIFAFFALGVFALIPVAVKRLKARAERQSTSS